jgi:hypothetical protein
MKSFAMTSLCRSEYCTKVRMRSEFCLMPGGSVRRYWAVMISVML